MPKISYREIVSADVSESGTVSHEWEYDAERLILMHTESIDGMRTKSTFQDAVFGINATKKWKELCQSK